MSLQGPVLIVAAGTRSDLIGAIEAAGVFPVIRADASDAETAIDSVEPAAVVIGDDPSADVALLERIAGAARPGAVLVPALALAPRAEAFPLSVLPVDESSSGSAIVATLRAALRVRALHASVMRRIETMRDQKSDIPPTPEGDPVNDATVLVAGRGGSYPALTTAVGERVGLIGAFSLEAALGYLGTRDVDAFVVGDGFNRSACLDLLHAMGADPRFRDLPVVVPAHVCADLDLDPERLPFLQRLVADPADVVRRVLPYARLHALSARLKRMVAALDAKGAIDPDTGLYTREVFVRDFSRAVADAENRGVGLAVARFSLDNFADARTSRDAARLVGRLVRAGDFACRDRDGTILVAFSETDLGAANVVARRIASVLKHTVLSPGCDRSGLVPTVTLAGLKSRDSAAALLARVTPKRLADSSA